MMIHIVCYIEVAFVQIENILLFLLILELVMETLWFCRERRLDYYKEMDDRVTFAVLKQLLMPKQQLLLLERVCRYSRHVMCCIM